MRKNNKITTALLPIVLAFFLVVGMFIGLKLNQGKTESLFIYPKTDKLNGILNYIEEEYVDTVNRNALVEAAIPSMLKKLDPHSIYIPAKDMQTVNEPLEGNFSGIGVSFNMQNDTVVVISIIPNGPSEKVGIQPGDRIVKVNDENVAGIEMPSDSIVKRLRGTTGTMVKVTVKRKNVEELLHFEIVRDKIPLYSIDISYMIHPGIGYIKINTFGRTTFKEFQDAIKKLRKENMEKLILDLRGNTGGYMDAATDIADQFLPENTLIVYTEGRSSPRRDVLATKGGLCLDIEILIIIDESSASASEILAGAIQDNDRGTVLGRRSFGKGLVQQQTIFSDGSGMRLTTARYYTPTGRSIQKPYNNGTEDYYEDLNRRYDHGEFEVADSIYFDDSLKYTTPKGKTVYGGGGIMPDIFVPIDTTGLSPFFMDVRNRGLIYRYAFKYSDERRSTLSNFTDPQSLEEHLTRQGLYQHFIDFAKKNGVKVVKKDAEYSRELIHTQIKAYIARNIIDNKGFYPILFQIDKTLQDAVKYIETEKEKDSLDVVQ